MKEVKLPSGALLKISVSPFADAKALYQALLREAKGISIASKVDVKDLIKEMLAISLSSEAIERCLWPCLQRCLYNGTGTDLKIDQDTFEPEKARQDYTTVCVEVAKENVLPFAKSLYAELLRISAMIENTHA